MSICLASATSARLLETLGQCVGISVLVLGDLMLDEYIEGDVERISPEAPVPVVRTRSSRCRLGGAANVAQQLTVLGAQVSLAGILGADAQGQRVRRLCAEAGINTAPVLTLGTRRTTRKLRILSQAQQLLRLDTEDTQPCSETEGAALLEQLGTLPRADALLISDYGKGVVTPALLARVLQAHPPRTGIIVVDPKHCDFGRYRGATYLTPNLRELSIAAGQTLDPRNVEAITAAAQTLARRGAFRSLVVTRGEYGILIVHAYGNCVEIPALKRDVYDVTGAGDTVAAVLTAALAGGADLTAAASLANLAAGIAVGDLGAVAVYPSRIREALAREPVSRVLPLGALLQRVQRWREAGDRIVMTNGCFDLLHAGHLSLLQSAKSHGDKLILAINSDSGVRRLKGPGRPVIPESDRAALLGALGCVDAVTIFDEDTPLDVVRCIQPDVLVKGGDYALEDVIGREIVEAAGGRVVLVPLLPNYSTSAIVARALTQNAQSVIRAIAQEPRAEQRS